MVKHYYSHRVYTNASFRNLLSLLSHFLVDNSYVVTSYDDDRDYKTLKYPPQIVPINGERKTNSLPHASIIASPARSIAEDSGEILFHVVHLRWAWGYGLMDSSALPINRLFFSECPNYLEINTHRKWYQLQEAVGKQFAEYCETNGYIAYIRTFEGELLDVIEGAYNDPDEKANAIHALVKNVFNWDKLPELEMSSIPLNFLIIIPHLQPDTLRALRTAEFLRSKASLLPDCSAIIIEYCKAVEIELKQKILSRLQDDWATNTIPSSKPPGSLKRLYEFVIGKGRPLELGTLVDNIQASLDPQNDSVDIAISLREVLFKNQTWMSMDFINQIQNLTRTYRNPAAHTAIMSLSDIEQCRALVIGTNEREGLLTTITQAGLYA